jgi:hypothetical protein
MNPAKSSTEAHDGRKSTVTIPPIPAPRIVPEIRDPIRSSVAVSEDLMTTTIVSSTQ